MLNEADARGISHIVRWQPEHQSFRVYDTAQFAQTVMPRYFEKQNRYKVSTIPYANKMGS